MNLDLEDEMCPNCVTPWKCNGPHLTGEEDMDEYKLEWRGLDADQKASIAVELLTEILEEIDEYVGTWSKYPEWWNKKDFKAMERTRDTLLAHYGIPHGD
jgi:hypothetical protein